MCHAGAWKQSMDLRHVDVDNQERDNETYDLGKYEECKRLGRVVQGQGPF